MCGILGIVATPEARLEDGRVASALELLFALSESRGKEAAGLALRTGGRIAVIKQPVSASVMLRSAEYRDFLDEALASRGGPGRPLAAVGHSRLATDGLQMIPGNNQPIVGPGLVGVHNGIVVNADRLWARHPQLERRTDVDSEVIFALLRAAFEREKSLALAATRTFAEIEGAASIATLFEDLDGLLLATNTGSLYYAAGGGILYFASERYILETFLERGPRRWGLPVPPLRHLEAGRTCWVGTGDAAAHEAPLHAAAPAPVLPERHAVVRPRIAERHRRWDEAREALARCSRCILPETFPFIEFDAEGVCSVCRDWSPPAPLGHRALVELADRHRRGDGEPECIVAFSGGRDSSYMLHYVKRELGLTPLAYTFDWGMVTDLARRNQSRICGRLGIEHVLVSADIKRKRRNIRKNVLAWLRRPELGMIPLFMAGDKQYFHHADRLRKQTGVQLVFLGGNHLEKTSFKSGFAGVQEGGGRTYEVGLEAKLRLAAYYGRNCLLNPRYLNGSLADTLHAFYSSYLMRHDFSFFYRYVPWDEAQISRVLEEEYGWEVARDTDSTWRIGDGTAAFYNYIYWTVAGFTENDTFRSNQIREGMIPRERGLALARRDNEPRYDSIREYARLIGFDPDEALVAIDSVPKLYADLDGPRS